MKALAITGAFGIVATVPVIVSSCSSTSDNNTGGDTNQGGGTGGDTQSEKITPELNDKVSLSGSLKDIYDSTGATKTNELLAKEIKDNINTVFKNGEKLEAETDLKITVNGNFPETLSNWKDLPYIDSTEASNPTPAKSWSATTNLQTVVYATSSEQINIKSLDDLHTQLSVEKTLKDILKAAGVTNTDTSTYEIKNRPGLTNDDLIHVNVGGTANDTNKTKTIYDLQIPTSDINLVVSDLSVKVEGKNIETTDSTKTTTELDFNIGIDSTTHYNQTIDVTEADEKNVEVNKVLETLKFVKTDKTIDNEALIKELGVYNVTFSLDGASIAKKETTARAATPTEYVVTLKATPNKNDKNTYVWDDGTSGTKDITFPVTIKIGS
ncbi:P35 family lipoprotein [Malacoplasma penetrans]|uniref:P35 family lipoprotein n=1 Tax=Malacoplasma penetrans TaxID=28227 RepID=UPI0022771E77|nr:P35 family lipoprotein [Malacoplasma penetrans]